MLRAKVFYYPSSDIQTKSWATKEHHTRVTPNLKFNKRWSGARLIQSFCSQRIYACCPLTKHFRAQAASHFVQTLAEPANTTRIRARNTVTMPNA